jgi:hypothetical protein
METIPGIIVTQHAGGGNANQYFLRGFNLDHGTDFATDFDGVPINLPTHAHGEGYTDLNFLIPELIQKLDWTKPLRGMRRVAPAIAAEGSATISMESQPSVI